MKTLRRKLLRDIYQSKGLLLAISSIIAVGVMCYVCMQSAYHNLETAKQDYYRQCRMADFWIDLKKAPVGELASLETLPGVIEIQPRIQFTATADIPGVAAPLNGLVISMPDQREPVLNDIVLRQGDYFTPRRRNEVVVNDAFARANSLAVGQTIHLLLNNRRQELVVVGTAISSEFVYLLGPGALMPDPKRFGVFYVKQSFAEEVFDFQGAANQVVGRFAAPNLAGGGRFTLETVLRQAEQMLYDFGVFAATPRRLQASNQFLSSEIDGLGAFAAILPVMFLAVAALVLNVLMTRLARQQRVVVGTLKAIGYGDGVIFWHFLKLGLFVGLSGGLLGAALGWWTASGMMIVYRQYFEFPELPNRFHVYTHAVGMTVSLVCAVVGSLHGARAMLRLQPAEAMRPEPPRTGKAILLERIVWLWRRFSSPWRMALRSVFRHRFRSGVGAFAAATGSALLATGFMMLESQTYLIDFQFQYVLRSDLDVVFEDQRGREALDEVRQMPGVDRAEAIFDLPCEFVNGPYRRKGGMTGLQENAQLTVPRDRNGKRIELPESGLVLSRRLAEILRVAAGDVVTVIPTIGQRRPIEAKIARIADSYLGVTVYARIQYVNRLVGEEHSMTGVQLLTRTTPDRQRQLYHTLKHTPGVASTASRQDIVANLEKAILESQHIFIGVLVGFAGVIFVASIVNAALVSLAERQREVATFLAMGYSQWQVGGMFLRENLTINLLGALLGLPVGYLLMLATAVGYNTDLIRLPVVWSNWIGLTTMLLAVGFALTAHLVVQWRIHRLNYLEALKVKE